MNAKTQHDVVWGLEIGGSAVRLIRLTRNGSAYRADRYAEAPLDNRWNGPDGASAALGRLGVQRLDEPVVVCLRDELVLHRAISLPAADAAALDEIVAGQLEVLIPTQADQFSSGWHGYGAANGDDLQRVWVAAARSDAVSRAAEGCRRLGRRADRIVPSLSAVATVWAHLGGDDGPVALIDIAAGCTAVAVAHQGRVLECGVVGDGVDRWIERMADQTDLTTAEAQVKAEAWAATDAAIDGPAGDALADAINDWSHHLREVCNHCLSELPAESRPKRAVLFGRAGAAAAVADAAAAALGIPVIPAALPLRLELPDGVSFDRVAAAVGAALCAMTADAPAIDLLAPEPDRPPVRKVFGQWAAILAWLLVMTVGLYLQDCSSAARLAEGLSRLETQTARQGGLERQKAIGDYLASMGPTPLDVLDRVGAAMPAGTLLMSFNQSRTRTGTTVTLAGLVPDAKAMPKMLDDLRALGTVSGEGRPEKKKFRFEVRLEINDSVRGPVQRDILPSATQPAGEPVATTQSSSQPAGAADRSVAPSAGSAAEPDAAPATGAAAASTQPATAPADDQGGDE